MTNGLRLAPSARRRAAAALAAVAVAVAGLVISLDEPASAALPLTSDSVGAATGPVTTSAGGVTLTVDPATGLTPSGGILEITGSGFKTSGGLYVAICHADGKAPASLQDCVGGPIPTANTSAAWAHISSSGAATAAPGQVAAKWGTGGTFSVNLTLPASDPASDALDCSKVSCAAYTVPDAGQDASQDLRVPLVYQAVASSDQSTSSSSPPSSSSTASQLTTSRQEITSTIATAPKTVQPKAIQFPSVVAGGKQEVLFAGFAKNEVATVTLSPAVALPAARADADGILKVDFYVPASLTAGTHLLRVVGQTSKTTGVAAFEVTAPVVSSTVVSSAAVSSAPVTSAVASSAPASSTPASSAIIVPPVSSSAAPSSAAPAVTPPPPGSTRPVWPWYVLGVVVLLWVGFALFMLARRRTRLAAEMREKDRILAEGAFAEQQRAAEAVARANSDAPTAYLGPQPDQPPSGYLGYHPGEHGLLSGRDNPDSPGLLSGQDYRPGSTGELPTTYLPPAPAPSAGQGPPAPPPSAPDPSIASADSGPPTGSWTPDFTSAGDRRTPTPPGTGIPPQPDAGGQGTAVWQPKFDDSDTDAGLAVDRPEPTDDDGSAGGRHSR